LLDSISLIIKNWKPLLACIDGKINIAHVAGGRKGIVRIENGSGSSLTVKEKIEELQP